MFPFTWLALPGIPDYPARMPETPETHKSEARDMDTAVRPARQEPESSGNEEPLESSSPPCYLREFSENAPERGAVRQAQALSGAEGNLTNSR
jgi:hypothetical protein